MGDAVKKLWNLSEDEKIQEYMEAIEKQRRDQWARESYVRREGREEVALQMLAENANIPMICRYTGLTEAEVKALKINKR